MYKRIFLPDEGIALALLPARRRFDLWLSELREV